MLAKDSLGRRGEALAASYLEGTGLQLVDRNWRCPLGEIDLVAIEGSVLVVVEVKTRSSLNFGHPLEGISSVKLRRLYLLGALWAEAHELRFSEIRVDAVAVVDDGTGEPRLEYLRALS
ncbi:YraN family protein [Arthrobacter sp. CAN_C5]|uniref:YraN family protein n=1 Tax=Arthrobacter sp. CAN_C5 TaxID=2760706 RepID=UPI001AE74CD0|nr:YraN family protein [Arthrobacter sp. CAN_C5]MBP2216389.1 putative endonuclease [Arthrobacter sp. CAN_C5]